MTNTSAEGERDTMVDKISADVGRPYVWLSNSGLSREMLFGFTCDLDNEPGLFAARVNAFKQGVSLKADDLPTQMWIAQRATSDDHRKLPNILSAGGFLTVSEPVADILGRFELGRSCLYPVDLLKSDRKSRFQGKYFFLNIAEVRRYFSPEHSARVRLMPNSQTSYIAALKTDKSDDDVSVMPSALIGPDIWIDDTIITQFFCSDRLVLALREADLVSRSLFLRCLVLVAN